MRLLLLFSILLVLFSCNKSFKYQDLSELPKDFSGTYLCTIVDSVQDVQYDSIGNPTGVAYKTYTHTDSIVISIISNTDSFLVTGLRMDRARPECRTRVENDKLNLDSDWSTTQRSKWLRGELILTNDALTIDYEWNNFDTWSSGATPYNGFTTGNGNR